jgi:hypothetical protein
MRLAGASNHSSGEESNMVEILSSSPWLVVCVLIALVSVACTAIVFLTEYFRKSRQAEIDAGLKQMMLERGMSAADIKTVLEASTDGEELRSYANQPVRVGLGKFQIEVGGANHSSSPKADAPARG